jgi:hypothetical protein
MEASFFPNIEGGVSSRIPWNVAVEYYFTVIKTRVGIVTTASRLHLTGKHRQHRQEDPLALA